MLYLLIKTAFQIYKFHKFIIEYKDFYHYLAFNVTPNIRFLMFFKMFAVTFNFTLFLTI